MVLSSKLEEYVWTNYVSKDFLRDSGFKSMYNKSFDTYVYRMDNDAYYFSEKRLGEENFYRLEYVKRFAFTGNIEGKK